MRQAGFQQAFNVGELGPDAWARSDLAQHSKGCILAWNMVPRVVGPIGRRRGTWFCGLPKHADMAWRPVPFRRSLGDALVLEFGHLYVRVWTVNGAPVMDGASQVEFESPYPAELLAGLRWRQVGDLMILTHLSGISPRVLRRNSNTSWSITGLAMINGPFRGENGGSTTLSLSGGTLSASAALFQPGHVGSLWRLRPGQGNPGVLSWEPEEEGVTVGAERLSNGRVYRSTGSGEAGNTPPVHDRGAVSDGKIGWEYVHDGSAQVYVTAYVSPTQVTVSVIGGLPPGLDTPTPFWSEGAYSDVRGWPSANPAVREERMVMGGAASEPDMLSLTRTAGYGPGGLDFFPGLGTGRVVDDDAVRRGVGDGERIVWLEGSTFLLAGTAGGEYLISGGAVEEPISPAAAVARPIGDYGSADVMPALAFGGVLFVAAGGQTLRRVAVATDKGEEQRDLTTTGEHIGRRRFVELAWTRQPENVLWTRMADGGLAAFSYHAEQNVEGWSRQSLAAMDGPRPGDPLGGGLIVEHLCVTPGPQGRPRLFIAARRIKNGAVQRLMLRMADREDELFLDAAEAYVGAPVGGVGGLDHLAGETATVMAATEADATPAPGPGWGQYEGRAVSEGGAVALPDGTTAGRLYAGLPYLSRWEGLPPELAGPGSTAGRIVRYTHAVVTLDAALCEVGTVGREGDSGVDVLMTREASDAAGPVVRRQAWRSALLGGAERDRRLFVQTRSGWDMVIHSVRATADVE